jgi:hypothetical protein
MGGQGVAWGGWGRSSLALASLASPARQVVAARCKASFPSVGAFSRFKTLPVFEGRLSWDHIMADYST